MILAEENRRWRALGGEASTGSEANRGEVPAIRNVMC